MTDSTAAALKDAIERNAANVARVETLKEVVAFHRSLRPAPPEDLEAAAAALGATYTEMGNWLSEALAESLIEAKRALVEMGEIHARILAHGDGGVPK